MHWLSNFYQRFYSSRRAHHTNFIIFGSQELQIWVKQVCIHLKIYFKLQFNSPRNFTTSVHFIFFLNTTLHEEHHKIWFTKIGPLKLHLWFSKVACKSGNKWTIFSELSHWQPDPPVSRVACQWNENRASGAARRGSVRVRRRRVSPATAPAPQASPRHRAPIELPS